MRGAGNIVGVSDHGGWAVLVTVAPDGRFVDRRRVELVDQVLPKLPHHHEAQHLPIDDGVKLVEQVRASASRHASVALDAVESSIPGPFAGVALRRLPPLPSTVAERIQNYKARNVADWVMYREAIARAAEARGWDVGWFDAKKVLQGGAPFVELRKSLGAPWTMDHRVAMAAAIHFLEPSAFIGIHRP